MCLCVRIRVAFTGLQESTGGAWGGPPRQRSDWNDTKLDDDGEEDSWEKQAEELYPADDESGPDPGLCFRARHNLKTLSGWLVGQPRMEHDVIISHFRWQSSVAYLLLFEYEHYMYN